MNKAHAFSLRTWLALAATASLFTSLGNAAEVTSYVVGKGVSYVQLGSGMPVANPYRPRFSFMAFVDKLDSQTTCYAEVQSPNLGSCVLHDVTDDRIRYSQSFTTRASMDAAFTSGYYILTITTPGAGTHSPSLLLTNDTYPNVPHIANWTATQSINAHSPFSLAWDPFVGGTGYDYIQLTIEDQGKEVFKTPKPGQPGALTGTATSVAIPADTLLPGVSYGGHLVFFKAAARNKLGFPGALGSAGYFRITDFRLTTANPSGLLQFSQTSFIVNKTSPNAVLSVIRTGGSQGEVSTSYGTYQYGSALENIDFVPSVGTLTFGAGQTSNTISIPILNNVNSTGPKSFGVSIFFPQGGASLGNSSFATVIIADDQTLASPDVLVYLAAKGLSLHQTNELRPAPVTTEPPFQFYTIVEPSFDNSVSSASLRLSNAAVKTLTNDYGHFTWQQPFATKTDLDASFPNGSFVFNIATLTDGNRSAALNLPSDAYPTSPHLTDWPEAQAIEPDAPFTFSWDPFVGGTANDYVQVTIEDDSGVTVFQTPALWAPNALNGTATSVTLPANTLAPGLRFKGSLMFAKVSAKNTTAYPGALGVAAFFKQTDFTVATVNPAGTLQFSTSSYSANETDGTATITVNRTGGSEGTVTVEYYTTPDYSSPTPATPAQDFDPVYAILTFGPGETSKTFNITIHDDAILEGPEGVALFLGAVTGGANVGDISSASLTIMDDEAVAISDAASYLVAKGIRYFQTNQGPVYLPAKEAPWVFYSYVDCAYPGAIKDVRLRRPDFTSCMLTNDSRRLSVSALFPDKTNLDVAFPNGTYAFFMNTLSDGMRTNKIPLTPDLYPNAPHLANWDLAQDIDASADFILAWDAFRNPADGDFISLQIFDANGTTLLSTPEITAPGALSGSVTNLIIPANTLSPGQAFQAKLMFAKRAAFNTTSYPGVPGIGGYFKETAFTITTSPEEPPAGRLQFSASEFFVNETGVVATITITRTRGAVGQVSVDFSTANGSALAGLDYISTAATVTLADGQTSATVQVPILDDSILEGTETVSLSLTSPVGAILGPQSNALLRIVDNELAAAGTLQFSASAFSASETNRYGLFTVVRTGATNLGVAVNYATYAGTAVPELEYTNVAGTLLFKPGVTTRSFIVPFVNDTAFESNKTVFCSLFSPSGGAALGARTNAVLSIMNDDLPGKFVFSTNFYKVSETGAVATITVLRKAGLAGGVTVDFTTANGTALAGLDYTPTNGTLAFGPGETRKTFTIEIINDSMFEPNKTVNLILSNPTGSAILGTISNAVLRIVDDEPEDVRGTYQVSGYMSFSSSVGISGANFSGTLNITTQNGRNFSGTASLREDNGLIVTLNSIAGTVNNVGQFSGYYYYSTSEGITGNGNFTGSLVGDTISLNMSGGDIVGRHSGTLTGSR